jgi:hypothetical protein
LRQTGGALSLEDSEMAIFIAGVVLYCLVIFSKPVILGGAAAAPALIVAAAAAAVFWGWRRRSLLDHLRRYGEVEFTSASLVWTPDQTALQRSVSPFLTIAAPFLVAAAVVAVMVQIIGDQGLFDPKVRLQVEGELPAKAAWVGSYIAGYLLVFGGGWLWLSSLRQKWQAGILADSDEQWEENAWAAAPAIAELEAESRALAELGETLGLQLDFDYAAEAAEIFSGLAERYSRRRDRALIDTTLALVRRRLDREKQAYAEAAAFYWEALAAIAEADIAAGHVGMAAGDLPVRLGDLKARLFAPHLLELLEAGETAGNNPAGDYPNITTAIAREAEAIAAEARNRTDLRLPPAVGDTMSLEEACAVLGIEPGTPAEEIARLRSGLLEVWTGDDAEAEARRQEITAAAAVLPRNPRTGPA